MSAQGLSSRAIIGEFYKTLELDIGASWIPTISNIFTSDQEGETYRWLGMVPAMREWIGGRQAKGFRTNGITITNLHFEATLEVLVREMRRDKTGQVMVRVRELALRANAHWAKLLSTLIAAGGSTVCYDGEYFFDTDHPESGSSQSNSISVDISELPAAVKGTTTAPSVEQMQASIMAAVQAIYGFVDDQGEPTNENARRFLVMVPPSLWTPAYQAVYSPLAGTLQSSLDQIRAGGLDLVPVVNSRLSAWTANFAVFRTDSEIKPLIRQQETDIQVKAIAEGSELEFNEDKHHYGIDAWRNVGYGDWKAACLVTMT
ncbi:MAG TPA: Mu-like prophage major head subunit gpT family protein [Candidatus Competibacteraceae bacterium]|nr:Mu-like prophage major head subunit gpT family protein [Candidatus Competibacteraceae bacterium]